MYKKSKKNLKNLLNTQDYSDELFSKSSMSSILRALLEPVANQNAVSLLFTRIKNKDNLSGLIKRLEYCTNVEIVDTTVPETLIKDDYIELEFVIFTSARYNFVLIWDYSDDSEKNYTKAYFLANSKNVNDAFEILQSNLTVDYREKFYKHRPERRENELLNQAIFNVFKKLNNSIEDSAFKQTDDMIIDISEEENQDDKIREISHEIKNQLSIMDVYVSLLEKQNGENKNTNVIKKSLSNVLFSLNELRNYQAPNIHELVLQDVISSSVEVMTEVIKANNNSIKFLSQDNDIRIFGDENRLISVFNNIIKNANESSKNDYFEIKLKLENNFAKISFINHGSLIDEASKKHLFDKGFTTKSKGQGIGLWSCKNIIEKHKGKLILLKSDSDSTIFEVQLPVY